ncbi:MAG TPA: cyclic pyranopterin monophosphate synthase MoaC [Clostridiaceae bacterium]|nr:cyclic pyranopterin monophosphate synthase MoaC [Clostridiaceae bacterium]
MEFSHLDNKGNARMVDVSKKTATVREAKAEGRIYMKADTLRAVMDGSMPKGDVLAAARIAGVMAAKRTSELIPMCHNIPLDSVKVDLVPDLKENCIKIAASVRCIWKTGVEMEALTAVSVAALTVYDMCKSLDKTMVIGDVMLVWKTGGKSGDFKRTRGEDG